MKRSSPFWRRGVLLAGFAVLLGAPVRHSPAIPNQIGGFINLAGMNFEDFAALPETWKPGAQLKATWERWKSPEVTDTAIELQRLTVSATIFGLPVSEVTVQRVDDQSLRFDAVFAPAKGATLAQLEQSLRRNLGAWADKSEDHRHIGGAAAIVVTPRPREGDIVVTFTSAASAAVAVR